jgi:hypothetical protein
METDMSGFTPQPRHHSIWWCLSLADRIAYGFCCCIVGGMAVVAVVAYASMILHVRWF